MTSYVGEILQPGEQMIYQAKITWIIYLRGIVITLFGGASMAADFQYSNLVIILGLFFILVAFIRRRTTELVITNKRVISKKGWIMRKSSEIHRSKIEGVQVDQSILGRVDGYGTITVHGTGSGMAPMKDIDDPLEFRKHVEAI